MTVTMVRANNLGTVCPTQWMAKDASGAVWYARYRYGFLSVDRWDNKYGNWQFFGEPVGDDLDGHMDYEDLKRHTTRFISWPEEQGWGDLPELCDLCPNEAEHSDDIELYALCHTHFLDRPRDNQ